MAEIYRLKTVANDRHHGRRSTTLLIDFIRWWAREDGNLGSKKVKEVPVLSAFTLSPIAVAFWCRQ